MILHCTKDLYLRRASETLDESKKGAYDNVYMQEMLDAVSKQEGHRDKGLKQISKIGQKSKGASVMLRIILILTFLGLLAGGVWLAAAEPQYTYVIGGFLAMFALFGFIVGFLRH